ncbi:MAG: MFS transporter [Streptococcaceae bacterium]|jgi:predicted MFS family arabinose efflux permease|nr:MFS transporter [Streptococcaceae bacterium]
MNVRKRTILLSILLVIFAIFAIYTFRYFHLIGSKTEIFLENINGIIVNQNDNSLIIQQGKQKIVKCTKAGQLDYVIQGGKKNFHEATEIAANKDDIYILDTVLEEDDSIHVAQQKILKYTNGKFIKTIFNHTYPKKERNRFEGNFQSLTYDNGKLHLIKRQKNDFILYEVNEKSKKLRKIKHFHFANADRLLHSFIFKNDEMFALSKDGDIYKILDHGSEIIYIAKDHQMNINGEKVSSFPWNMALASDGAIFATDICTRSILRITPSSKKVQFLKQPGTQNESLSKQPLYYHLALDKKDKLFLSGDNALVEFNKDNGKITKEKAIEVQFFQRLYSFGFIFSVSILLILSLFLLYPFIKRMILQISKDLSWRLEMGILIFIAITAFFVSNMVINNYNERYKNEVLGQMSSIATLVASILDQDALKEIDSPQDFTTKAYAKIRKQIVNVVEDGNKWNEPRYIELYKIDKDIIYTFANTNNRSGSYYPWEWPYEGSVEQKIVRTKKGIQKVNLNTVEGAYLYALNPIFDDQKRVIGLIEVGSNMDEYVRRNNQIIRKIIFSTISLVVVMMLIVREMLTFLETYQQWKKNRQESLRKPFIHSNVVRPIVFASFFASNLAAAFMPIYAASIYTPFLGISKNIASALPMTFEVLFVALGFVGGSLSEKLGIKKMLNISLVCFTLGLFGCGLAQNVWQLIIGNAISGFGSGMTLVVVNVYISSLKNDKERESGFTSVNAAILSGINSSVIIGASLAGFIGNRQVFYIACLVVVMILGYVYYFIDKMPVRKKISEEIGINFLKFLFKPKILVYFLGILIPYLACSYFLHYFFPIFGEEKGLSESEIGQAFLLNGVWVVFLGPIIAKFILEKFGKIKAVLLGVFLYAAAFAVFGFNPTLLIALIVLIVMGIADSFTFTAQNVYFSSLKEVELYGVNKSIGAYSLFENLGQAVGPLLFSTVLILGKSTGILIVCGVLLFVGLIFGLLNLKKGG